MSFSSDNSLFLRVMEGLIGAFFFCLELFFKGLGWVFDELPLVIGLALCLALGVWGCEDVAPNAGGTVKISGVVRDLGTSELVQNATVFLNAGGVLDSVVTGTNSPTLQAQIGSPEYAMRSGRSATSMRSSMRSPTGCSARWSANKFIAR